jgi:plasmid maintenance system killer protein
VASALPLSTMQVAIADKKLKRAFENDRERQKRFGNEMAKKIQLRVNALTAAESLGDFWPPLSPPERCHELKADLDGYFSMDLTHPYRLLFKPIDNPSKATGQLELELLDQKQRWHSIKSIVITGIEDTHG